MANPMYYSTYLQLSKILDAQTLESDKVGKHAHDEMLFIVIHQSYELWFKQVLFEVDSIKKMMESESINDNSPAMATVVRRLNRVIEILRVLVHQIDILETMTPLDFLEFRDLLRPASGFQSIQWKVLESGLGLKMDERHGQAYYTSQLNPEDLKFIESISNQTTVLDLVDNWLARMPFFDQTELWNGQDFWQDYKAVYASTLREEEKGNLASFEDHFFNGQFEHRLSLRARRAALFITLYRDYPMLQNPYRILNHLLDIDELMATWRWRHMNMVHRMIGGRSGTGGSTGKGYLREAAIKHFIFGCIAEVNSFMVNRSMLPSLPTALEHKLGFNS
jgi:tryptophan 2,3-dioxygenase